MQRSVSPERLINILLTMIDDVVDMALAYEFLPNVVDREFEIIKAGRYGHLDQIVSEKVTLSESIERHFDSLNHQAKLLLIYHKEVFSSEETVVRDLTHCAKMFDDFAAELKDKNVVVEQTINFNLKKFKDSVEKFTAIAAKVKPTLELNRTVVSQIAYNYQESNRFWRELNEEKNSPYNNQGMQKSPGQNSAIIAKA